MNILWIIKSFVMSAAIVFLMAVLMHQVKRACHKYLSGNRR
ncbi:MAG: hypothetical protein PUG71_08385 [bacterium]|nr:hypothetical protein [bacterium]